jgi:hypothetical protein
MQFAATSPNITLAPPGAFTITGEWPGTASTWSPPRQTSFYYTNVGTSSSTSVASQPNFTITNSVVRLCDHTSGTVAYYPGPATRTSATVTWYNDGGGTTAVSYNSLYYIPQKAVPERIREIIQSRCAPVYVKNRNVLGKPYDIREVRARETLRRVIGEDKYRGFLTRGFVSARAKSGLTYQIFPGHGITKVYNNGKMVEKLCVVLSGDFPPTDSLIVRFLMILNNEDNFRSYAVRHRVDSSVVVFPTEPEVKSLVEIYRDIKKAA